MQPQKLSPQAQQVLVTKSLIGAWRYKDLLRLFSELSQWDNSVELRKKKADQLLSRAVIGGVIAFFAAFFAGSMTGSIFVWLLLWAWAPPLVYIAYRKKKDARAVDIPNEFQGVILPVLKTLAQDIDLKDQLRVHLDFTGVAKRDTAKSSGTLLSFEEPLCHIRIPLRDGSEAVLRIENEFHKLIRERRNARGKVKTKTKWTKVSTVTTTLLPAIPCQWRPFPELALVEKNGVTAARLSNTFKFKSIGDEPEDIIPGQAVITMFLRLVQLRIANGGAAA